MSSTRMTLLVGTTKGAFLISGDNDRSGWAVQGPYCDGWPINHVIGDPETGALWAGGGGEWHGAGIWRSEDGGTSWKVTRLTKGKNDDWAANDPNFRKDDRLDRRTATLYRRIRSNLVTLLRAWDAVCRH